MSTRDNLIFSLDPTSEMTQTIADRLGFEHGKVSSHLFPDGEHLIRIDSDVKGKNVYLLSHFSPPDTHLLPLIFFARTAKELGAKKVCLISPYLPYMRQDKRFHEGEAITSTIFAELLSQYFDSLITVDPHLHRIKKLNEIYKIPETITLHATHPIAAWINNHIDNPYLIGPDEESEQWVAEIANLSHCQFAIMQKTRHGDKEVSITFPVIPDKTKTLVMVDDIISTGTSMAVAIRQLIGMGFKQPICIAIHGLFCGDSYQQLLESGAAAIITCNTLHHPTNQIDLSDLISQTIAQQMI